MLFISHSPYVSEADNIHVTVLEELSDTRSRVGLSDLGSLLGVEPD
jgi:hypothetical protein